MALSFFGPAHAAQMCEYVFTEPQVKARGADFGLRSEARQPETPLELLQFKTIKGDLWATLEKIPPQRKAQIEHLLASVEFFDYTHTAEKILPNFLEGKREVLDFSVLYDRAGEERSAPFKGFLRARDNFLRKEQPPITAELLSEIHKRIMENGVEGVRLQQLGVWRDGHWTGNVAGAFKVTPKEAEILRENPYLSFEEGARSDSTLNENVWKNVKIWGSHRNMVAETGNAVEISGRIHYPYVKTPKQETVDLIKNSHPEVYKQIMEYREQHGTSYSGQGPQALEQAFTKALVEERFARFNAERAALGEVKIGINEHRYIDLVADLQRDLVAIHPVLNGNGRTTRLLMNYMLTKEGLPPVRLVDPFLDVQVSQKEWREYVHKGVVNNAKLQADVLFRLKNGLTVEHSPELLYPGLPEMVSISLKQQGKTKEVQNYAQAKVDAGQFNAFIKALMQKHPELTTEIKNNRLRAMSRIADLFVEYYRSKTVRYIHDKDGEREIGLRLVDPDFVDLFAVNRSGNKTLWDAKIDRWYDKDMLVWRGLSNKTKEPIRQELLDYFKKPTSHLVSNSVLRALRAGTPLVQAIKADFALFNKESLNGDMVEMAIDHHRSGPKYGISYGYSTSKREVVGKAFAMGAMVVGEYGKHMDPALQAQLKSRINVASYRALKDVDLGRLKAFDPEFSYTYGRQAEVMGIGGTDPDAVMLIQKLDATGKVMETLLRNVEKPNEVLVIDGRYVPGEGPLPTERIKERLLIQPTTP
ncbi:Fic family protein [Bdellovibrio sp. ArHS]|uniref:Fic family protein n=1 Tax=Bdellovibrio sp. ArHS TaxID=1569284 RepID=UPI0025C3DFD5|nr:Fic family protein [Bdellovibrio sp. ArHS]